MLTPKEKRFLKYWEEQRKGSKVGYYALYIFIWFFVYALSLFFIFNNFIYIEQNKIRTLYVILAVATGLSVATTHLIYNRNELKYRKITHKGLNDDS